MRSRELESGVCRTRDFKSFAVCTAPRVLGVPLLYVLFYIYLFIYSGVLARAKHARSGAPWVRNLVNYPSEKIWL